MSEPHYYDGLKGKIKSELSMREVAEKVADVNHGVHQFLSHLIDVRRERLMERIQKYNDEGSHDVAEYAAKAGDTLADGIEALLKTGLY